MLPDRRLNGFVIISLEVESRFECAHACVARCGCVSFNMMGMQQHNSTTHVYNINLFKCLS